MEILVHVRDVQNRKLRKIWNEDASDWNMELTLNAEIILSSDTDILRGDIEASSCQSIARSLLLSFAKDWKYLPQTFQNLKVHLQ